MDRTKSGIASFNNNFATITSAPIEQQKKYSLRLLIDKSSIEAFDGNGKFAMTNLVFPEEPYNGIKFHCDNGSFRINSMKIHQLGK